MPTVSNSPRLPCAVGAAWRTCAGCEELFPAAPDQSRCRECAPDPAATPQCQAAHPDDRSACEGPPDAVRVVDVAGGQAYGCVRHAATMLAAIADARVYPSTVPGAAIDAYHRAASLREGRPVVRRPGGGR
jgi:hypothetical protein